LAPESTHHERILGHLKKAAAALERGTTTTQELVKQFVETNGPGALPSDDETKA
jgi:hypothetical protein